MTIVYVTHPRFVEHDLAGHPEHAGRIRAVWQRLEEGGLTARMQKIELPLATSEQMRAVHHESYLAVLERTAGFDRTVRLDADTYVCPTSYEVARLAAGGGAAAAQAVALGHARAGLAVLRPPGHHAEPERGMGFCLLNNIAIAARAAQAAGAARVFIVDIDVHHGNGTEAAFYEDDTVLFLSLHQYPLYPGTGHVDEIGRSAGTGYTINIPIPPGEGDPAYAALFEQIVWPAAVRFRPDLLLVSAGFDAHWADPLAGMRLSLSGYGHLCAELIKMANDLCAGRIVFFMEGGYNLDALSHGVCNIARLLLGEPIVDPLGPADVQADGHIAALIERLKGVHQL
ncbi:MAG: histone deacetylase [Aggregatilineales bacterium]